MNLNRSELKKTMSDFNVVSSRLMRAHFEDYTDELRRFINFIRNAELIMEIVTGCGESSLDIAKDVKDVVYSHGECLFDRGETEEEEIRNVFGILSYLVDQKTEIHYEIALGYSSSEKYQDMIDGFNNRFVFILIQNIGNRMKKIGIDMGLDDNRMYSINAAGGQVIIANDNASVVAHQHNGIDEKQLSELIQSIRERASDLSINDKEDVLDYLKSIEHELKSQAPKKGIVNGLIKAMQAIKGSAEFAGVVLTFYQFVQSLNLG